MHLVLTMGEIGTELWPSKVTKKYPKGVKVSAARDSTVMVCTSGSSSSTVLPRGSV